MKTIGNKGEGIISYDVTGINCVEMNQIITMARKLDNILDNHASGEKKIYPTDEDLEMCSAILHAFMHNQDCILTLSEFDGIVDSRRKVRKSKFAAETMK